MNPHRLWIFTLAATLLSAGLILFWRLDARPVQNWDEAIHGQVSREMVESGDWVDLSYRNGNYFRKPPLSFWLRSLAMVAFGDTVWSLRLWSALAGLATALLLGWWAWQWWKNRWLALLTVGIFVTGRFVFFHAFRTGESDGLLVLFITLALYGYWRSWTVPRWIWLSGAATGLAILTKSAGGLLPLLIIAADLLVSRRWPFRWRNVGIAAGLALVIAAPWHILEWLRHGTRFWNDYIGLHVIERVTEQIHNEGTGTLWYVSIFFKRFYPWSWFVPFALIWGAGRWLRQRDAAGRLLLIWFVVTFAFFTFTKTKFDWYILPLYPAAVLLVTPWLATMLQRPSRTVILAHAVSFAGFLAILPGAIHQDSVLRWLYPITTLTATTPNAAYLLLNGIAILAFVIVLPLKRPGWLSLSMGGYALGKMILVAFGFSLLTIRAERPDLSPLPALTERVEASGASTLYVKGVDLINYPAAYWYFRGIPNTTLIDLERGPFPATFGIGDALIIRDPAQPPTATGNRIFRAADFTVYLGN